MHPDVEPDTPRTHAPQVSVHVITYNQAHLIEETLESILSQDYENLQVVVADDYSTDGTRNILLEYQAKYPDKLTLVLNERNLGITGNCNAALAACAGELIAFIGGDDVFLPGKIRAQVQDFIAEPTVVLSYHPVEIFRSDTGQTLYVTNQHLREDTHSAEEIIEKCGIPGPCSIMVRRSACPTGGFDERLPTASDWFFMIEVALKGKVAKVGRVLARYRKHAGNVGNHWDRYSDEFIRTLELVETGHPERPELRAVCQRGRARYLAGAAFRKLTAGDAMTARELLRRAIHEDPGPLKYRLSLWATRLPYAGLLAARSKFFLKRWGG